MTSNNTPSGEALASSSYSSSYYPYKALDYEPSGWSGWISHPTGTFTTQWLSYEFDDTVTIMAYKIEPQTGNNPDRSPKNWKLQAWNGSAWDILDTRSNYTISSWLEETSRQFSVKYPKKYKKYRLYVEQVNGSDVVSIRKFEIYGIGNSGSKKASISNEPLPLITDYNKLYLNVYPNPNNGVFKIYLNNLDFCQNLNTNDSIQIANNLKSGISADYSYKSNDVIIEIYDMQGKKVYSRSSSGNEIEINLENVNQGIYLLKAIVNNRDILTKKIMVKGK